MYAQRFFTLDNFPYVLPLNCGPMFRQQMVKVSMNDLCNICHGLGLHDYSKFWMLRIFFKSYLHKISQNHVSCQIIRTRSISIVENQQGWNFISYRFRCNKMSKC